MVGAVKRKAPRTNHAPNPTQPSEPFHQNRVLRQSFEREHGLPPGELDRRYHVAAWQARLHLDYREWLRTKSIDPKTGPVNEEGRAFLEKCRSEGPYIWTLP